MYGSCIEDVNHEIYGGLYAQMIFGESFEEPPRSPAVAGLTTFGGQWSLDSGVLSVAADFGAKIVRDGPELEDASISCVVRLHEQSDNAGLIARVRKPRTGADDWTGYEISISAKHKRVILGRHDNNFALLASAPAEIQLGAWHKLGVNLRSDTIRIYVDGAKEPAITYTDNNAIHSGRVGLRTWGSNADFRELVIERAEGHIRDAFSAAASSELLKGVSGMWDLCRTGNAVADLAWDADRPFNTARSQRLERTAGTGRAGVSNRGLNRWGLTVREGHVYAGHLYLRQAAYDGAVTVSLESADGAQTLASQSLATVGADWGRHEFSLRASATNTNARFTIAIDRPGKVWVDQVYLSGTGPELFGGLPFRADIARGLQEEGLTLLRYGGSMVNAPGYRWKTMIGDRDRRPQYRGTWYPYSTNGFGIEEFVAFCRAAGFEPVVAINIEETPTDAADLVEYLNGPLTTTWGRRRAENGHPEPYGVRYIEIGNEETTNAHYLERFHLLYDAMRTRDAKVEYIIGAWWEPENPVSRRIVQELSEKAALWDVHVGGDDPREGAKVDALFTRMERLYQEWKPGTPLKACVLEENGGQHNVRRALGHAGILNATERHGDFVLIDCPANCLQPWKQNDNGWDQGQLFFTSSVVWGMPPYYAQQMTARAHLPIRLASEVKSPGNDLDLTATRDEGGRNFVLKIVNAGDKPHRARFHLTDTGPLAARAEVVTLSGALDEINVPENPERVRPQTSSIVGISEQFSYDLLARSYTIIHLQTARDR
jgi:alpha-L-arabinofuranosidase